ncbi:MAG: hypothetical protein K2X47_19220, partial [Bdellovibrionales bacterium]|nr:hypothetical protein [Bdellovibrionales bacterium]
MFNQRMAKAGKILFLGSLLVTSVGLSPKHLTLSGSKEEFISFSSKAPMKVIEKTINGKKYELKAGEVTSTKFIDGDDGEKEKFRQSVTVEYKPVEGT